MLYKNCYKVGRNVDTKWDSFSAKKLFQSGMEVVTKWESFFVTKWDGVVTKEDR